MLLRAVGLTLIPVLITGGIHVDGYMDTCDALSSHRDTEGKLSILKDPHIGAFALIRLVCLFLLVPALWQAYPANGFDGILVALIFIFSRCLSGLSVLTFPISGGSGMAALFSDSGRSSGNAALGIQSAECILTAVLLCLRGPAGILCVISGIIVFLYYKRMSLKEFGGLNGDQAGWFLTCAETWMLGVMVFYGLFTG